MSLPDACLDLDAKCAPFKQRGYCESFPEYMSKNCKKTCGLCTAEENVEVGSEVKNSPGVNATEGFEGGFVEEVHGVEILLDVNGDKHENGHSNAPGLSRSSVSEDVGTGDVSGGGSSSGSSDGDIEGWDDNADGIIGEGDQQTTAGPASDTTTASTTTTVSPTTRSTTDNRGSRPWSTSGVPESVTTNNTPAKALCDIVPHWHFDPKEKEWKWLNCSTNDDVGDEDSGVSTTTSTNGGSDGSDVHDITGSSIGRSNHAESGADDANGSVDKGTGSGSTKISSTTATTIPSMTTTSRFTTGSSTTIATTTMGPTGTLCDIEPHWHFDEKEKEWKWLSCSTINVIEGDYGGVGTTTTTDSDGGNVDGMGRGSGSGDGSADGSMENGNGSGSGTGGSSISTTTATTRVPSSITTVIVPSTKTTSIHRSTTTTSGEVSSTSSDGGEVDGISGSWDDEGGDDNADGDPGTVATTESPTKSPCDIESHWHFDQKEKQWEWFNCSTVDEIGDEDGSVSTTSSTDSGSDGGEVDGGSSNGSDEDAEGGDDDDDGNTITTTSAPSSKPTTNNPPSTKKCKSRYEWNGVEWVWVCDTENENASDGNGDETYTEPEGPLRGDIPASAIFK
jgi:hypothetical protein